MAVEPDYVWGWLQLGKLRSHFGDTAGALAAVERGLDLEPGDYEFTTLARGDPGGQESGGDGVPLDRPGAGPAASGRRGGGGGDGGQTPGHRLYPLRPGQSGGRQGGPGRDGVGGRRPLLHFHHALRRGDGTGPLFSATRPPCPSCPRSGRRRWRPACPSWTGGAEPSWS
ncbi:hypothetical protein M5E87_25240 [Flavonifractor plautii]|nr:hypothetical protein M5E87_25240 [Flavonifractor plautii]